MAADKKKRDGPTYMSMGIEKEMLVRISRPIKRLGIDTAFALAPSVGVDEMLRNAQKIFQWLSAGTVPAPKGELRAV